MPTNNVEPVLVRGVGPKVVVMNLDLRTGGAQSLWHGSLLPSERSMKRTGSVSGGFDFSRAKSI
jgi:hypothetical protein